MNDGVQQVLDEGIQAQRVALSAYEQRSEIIVLEVVRALDRLFFRELLEPNTLQSSVARLEAAIMSWGTNHALRRTLPLELRSDRFILFRSTGDLQAQADDFLFRCGALQLGERMSGWLREGLVTGRVRVHDIANGGLRVLVLRTAQTSLYDEVIGRAGLTWESNRRVKKARPWEAALLRRYNELLPAIEARCDLIGGWVPAYATTPELDDFFGECGEYYLDRMSGRDLLALDDEFGGKTYELYLHVAKALSGRAHKHLAYVMAIRRRYPNADIRNLLTIFAPIEDIVAGVADCLGGTARETAELLEPFTLSPQSLSYQTAGDDAAFPSLIRASAGNYILPLYGLDLNPYWFLFRDLRVRFEADWFKAANRRERRWINELTRLFGGRGMQTCDRAPKLKSGRTVRTDIDFAAYDERTGDLMLFQLKWQQPVGMDNRSRRSMGANLVAECNKWIAAVHDWLSENGVNALMELLGFKADRGPRVTLFIVARYNAHFSGYDNRDLRATWTTWSYLQRARLRHPGGPVSRIRSFLRSSSADAKRKKGSEAMVFPLGELTVLLNPTEEPPE